MGKIKLWLYYFIIGIISLIALVFLPMVGSEAGMGWNLPTTSVGWTIWVATKLIVATINILLFHCFMQQAILNVQENEKYKQAKALISQVSPRTYDPRSPSKFNKEEYGKKGVVIFITTALSTGALTQAILTFDYMSMLTYLFTIVMGLIFGIIQMKKAETYWTTEFCDYAIKLHDKLKQKVTEKVTTTEVKIDDSNQQQNLSQSGRTSPEE